MRRQGGKELVAETGLGRAARYIQPGEPSASTRELHRRGGRRAEELYPERWRHDKVVRSTHEVNCTGSCSWRVFVKDGIITWEPRPSTSRRSARAPPSTSLGAARGGVFFVVHPLAGEGPLPLRASRPPGPSCGRSPGLGSATTPSAPGKGSLAQQGAFPTSGCAGGPHSDAERARKQKLHREHPQGFPKPESPAPPAARAQAYEAQVAR